MTDKELFDYYRLFSGQRRLTVQEREMILDTVVSECAMSRKTRLRAWLRTPAFVRAAAVCAMLLVAVPAFFLLSSRSSDDNEFTEKGDEGKPFVRLQCVGPEGAKSCMRGDTLTFRVRPPSGKGYFSAFAKHGEDGNIVWYYPTTESEESLLIEENSKNGLLDIGVVLGAEHASGEYDVFGVFSETAYKREDIRLLFENRGDTDKEKYRIVETVVHVQ